MKNIEFLDDNQISDICGGSATSNGGDVIAFFHSAGYSTPPAAAAQLAYPDQSVGQFIKYIIDNGGY